MTPYAKQQAEERRSTMPRQLVDWTPERVETLRRMWDAGFSGAQIAAKLGVTRNAVIGKIHRLKLHRHGQNWTPTPRSHKAGQSHRTKPHGNKGQAKGPTIVRKALERCVEPPLPIPDDLPDVTHRIGVLQLGNDMCRWPIGDPLTPDFSFCGAPVQAAEGERQSPYCEHHHQRAYTRRTAA